MCTYAQVMIRTATPEDLDALYEVCLRTGAAGSDATDRFEHPKLLGQVYVGPYVVLRGCIPLTYEDELGTAGYALAAIDTDSFLSECERSWWPSLRAVYPDPGPAPLTYDQEIMSHIHRPPRPPREVVAAYPAHLHIDLLPRIQGMGLGREMIARLLEELRARGASGVHLEVDIKNRRAIGFYEHLGFGTLMITGDVRYMGYPLL